MQFELETNLKTSWSMQWINHISKPISNNMTRFLKVFDSHKECKPYDLVKTLDNTLNDWSVTTRLQTVGLLQTPRELQFWCVLVHHSFSFMHLLVIQVSKCQMCYWRKAPDGIRSITHMWILLTWSCSSSSEGSSSRISSSSYSLSPSPSSSSLPRSLPDSSASESK